jgi:3-oxoacyl-[acyl-carrier protein] reductase
MNRKPKLVVISGASKGLGFELASLIELKGNKVIRLGFNTAGNVDYRCDLRAKEDTLECIGEIRREFGEIDLLISNAGGGKKPLEVQDEALIVDYFNNLNFVTAKNLIEASLPSLRKSKGIVIAISSIVALKDIPDAPLGYSKAKKELNQYIRTVAKREAKNGVRANIISPGNLMFPNSRWAELLRENPEFVQDKIQTQVPLGSFISPTEVASAILFLSSTNGANITGANIVIDGGQSL